MALVLKDRVLETASAPGTGSVSLLGAVTGYQSFSSAIGNANTCYYTIADQSGANWEVGIGTYTSSGNTLARTTVLSSSNGGSLTNFASGIQNVFVTYPSEKAVYLDASGNVSALGTIASGTWNASTIGVANGGTGQISLATGSIAYGQGTSAHAALAIGTAGQILTVNSGATAPQWSTLSGVAVTTFQTSLGGLTPSTATSGAVTLAGTLNTSSGGTGLATYTAGDLPYYASGTALSKLGIGTSGYILSSSGTAPQWVNSISIGSGTFTSVTDSGLTAGRVNYNGTGGLLVDSANLTFDGTTLTANKVTSTNDASIHGLTVGLGGGSVSTNTVLGASVLSSNTSGLSNTGVGYQALNSNNTANNNTAVGYQAGYSNTTSSYLTAIGGAAGYYYAATLEVNGSTFLGFNTGRAVTTGHDNNFLGSGAGYSVTTGSYNTIIGGYTGNQGGLDIRTSSNYIVLSDGAGNPRVVVPSGTATATIPNATGTVMVSGNMPAFSAYQSSAQSVSNSTATKVQFQTINFDTANKFTSNTTYTPNVAGYYQVNAFVSFSFTSGPMVTAIYKNAVAQSYTVAGASSGGATAITTALIYMNGTTDYLEVYTTQFAGSSQNISALNYTTYFQASMVRAA